jgi:hypothetical protein
MRKRGKKRFGLWIKLWQQHHNVLISTLRKELQITASGVIGVVNFKVLGYCSNNP